MEKFNLRSELYYFEAELGMFVDFCAFVDFGAHYMYNQEKATDMIYAALKTILHESKRVEKIFNEITDNCVRANHNSQE